MAGKHLSVLVHFIWSTAGREPWLAPEWSERLYASLGGVLREKNAKLISAGGTPDHIHLYVSLPSTVTLAESGERDESKFITLDTRNIPPAESVCMAEGLRGVQCE